MVAALLLTIVIGIGASPGAAAQGAFADVPRGRWEYRALNAIEADGIPILPRGGCIGYTRPKGGRTLTRFEIAVGVDRTMRNLVEKKLANHSAGLLRELVLAYTPELHELGVSEPQRAKWLSLLWQHGPGTGPFPDVEPTHWAAGAVQRMRESGVLRGYPDGLFHG